MARVQANDVQGWARDGLSSLHKPFHSPPRTNQGPGTYPQTKVQGHRATTLRGSGVRQGPAKDPPGTHQGRSKVRLARGHGPWAELIIKNRALMDAQGTSQHTG